MYFLWMAGKTVPQQPLKWFWEGFNSVSHRLVDADGTPMLLKLKAVFRIHMFLGLPEPDPDPSVRGMDPDPPDPYVFGPPGIGSGSISHRYGSGSTGSIFF
jgi:hypothetical protein